MSVDIIQGEDRNLNFTITKIKDNIFRPFPLAGWTNIEVVFKAYDGSRLRIDTVPAHGRYASAEYEGVTYTADNIGVDGNNIGLVFDGSKDIATVLNDWNTANPSNTASSDAEDETVVPSAATVNLEGGLDDYQKVTVEDEAEGRIKVRLDNEDTNKLLVGSNQDVGHIIDFGEHDLGNRRKAISKNAINVLSQQF